jgi:hypothetical protein
MMGEPLCQIVRTRNPTTESTMRTAEIMTWAGTLALKTRGDEFMAVRKKSG